MKIGWREQRVTISSVVGANADRVWHLLTDTTLWPRWGPSVRAVHCPCRFLTGTSRGWVVTPLGLRLPFAITAFDDGHYWLWRIGPITATGHRVSPLSTNSCRLAFDLPWWGVPYLLICAIALRRIRLLAENPQSP